MPQEGLPLQALLSGIGTRVYFTLELAYRCICKAPAVPNDNTRNENQMPKFPEVQVQLTGEDGNAFAIIGAVSKALKRAGHGEAAAEFQAEAMSGDYDHLLQTAMDYVDVM